MKKTFEVKWHNGFLIPIRTDNLKEQYEAREDMMHDMCEVEWAVEALDEFTWLKDHKAGMTLSEFQINLIIEHAEWFITDYSVSKGPGLYYEVKMKVGGGDTPSFFLMEPTKDLHITKTYGVNGIGLGINNKHCHKCIKDKTPMSKKCMARFVNAKRPKARRLFKRNADILMDQTMRTLDLEKNEMFNLVGTGDVSSVLQITKLFFIAITNPATMFSFKTSNRMVLNQSSFLPSNVTVVFKPKRWLLSLNDREERNYFIAMNDDGADTKYLIEEGTTKVSVTLAEADSLIGVTYCNKDCKTCHACFTRSGDKYICFEAN